MNQEERVRILLDNAGIEHSGLTLEERVKILIYERDYVRRLLIKIKVKQNRGEK